MSPLIEQTAVFAVMAILVALFAWTFLRDKRQKVGFWMVGWAAVLVHFAVSLTLVSSHLSQNWDGFLRFAMLEIAGMSFLLSVSAIFSAQTKRFLILFLVGAPQMAYLACLIWTPHFKLVFPVLLAASATGALISGAALYGISRNFWQFFVVAIPYCSWATWQAARGRPIHGLVFFLCMLFFRTGMLYWRAFGRKISPGVLTTSVSFLAWGTTFPLAMSLNLFHLGPSSDNILWELPKYFVAFGMILTLFENETAIANSAASQYQILFEESLSGVYVCSLQGELLDCNGAFAAMSGFASKQELLAQANLSFNVEIRERRNFLEQLVKEGQVANYECRKPKKDGSLLWVLERAAVFTTASGQKLIEGTVTDITERKQAEIALQQSEELFASLFRLNPIGCCITALDGRILKINDIALKSIGLPLEQVVGKSAIDIGFWKTPEERRKFFLELQTNGAVQNWPVEFTNVAGVKMVGLYFAQLVCIGEKQCIFGIYLDRTEQRDLETKFLQAQKMEALGRLAGGVAHDFNNLLSIIGGYTELLELRMAGSEDYLSYCHKILDTTRRASGLTRQLLTFSRREIARPTALEPDKAIRELASILPRLLGEDIELVLNLHSQGAVMMDRTHFEQIIFNIAVNARDAMPTGGRMSIQTQTRSRKKASANYKKPRGQWISISVSDTGTGMDEETRLRAFEPFFTTKEEGKGTGLGLATVYGIIQQCGGEVNIESHPGAGTQIKVLLPVIDAFDVISGEPSASVPVYGQATILLVEDEKELREANVEFLSSLGYSVLSAGNGLEALALAQRSEHIDLVVTDVVMPEMNGREFADALLQLYPETRVLFVSGYTDDVVLQRGVSSLEMAFLQKPFSLRTLATKVAEMVSSGGSVVANSGFSTE